MNINTISNYINSPFLQDALQNNLWEWLNPGDCNVLARVSQSWCNMAKPVLEAKWSQIRKDVVFGENEWLQIPDVFQVSKEPKLPENIDTRLKDRCKFFAGKVYQHQRLIFIPEIVNNESVTADSIGKIMRFLRDGDNETVFEMISGSEGEGFRAKKVQKSYWIFMTTDVVPNSQEKKLFIKQERLIEKKGYRLPSVIEAITGILIMNLDSAQKDKGYYFGQTYTRTIDEYQNWKLSVGKFSRSSGLTVIRNLYDNAIGGVGVVEIKA